MSSDVRPQHVNLKGYCGYHISAGKRVQVYTTPNEHWCIVHNPEDYNMTAGWRMPRKLSAFEAAMQASRKTGEEDYEPS